MAFCPAESTDMECKGNGITTLKSVLLFSSHINEHQTSDLSGELAYIEELGSIFTIDDSVCALVFEMLVCTCGHES